MKWSKIELALVIMFSQASFGVYAYRDLSNVENQALKDAIVGANVTQSDIGGQHSGNTYYVDSGVGQDTGGRGGKSWSDSWATIDYAVGRSNSADDIIYVREGHSETKSATGALLTCDVAGQAIIGLGTGSNRPKLILSHTGAKIDITANNVRLENIYIDATGVDSVNTPLNVSGEGVVLNKIFARVADTVGQADVFLTIGSSDGDANDLIVANSQFIGPDTGAASFVSLAKDMENVMFVNCYLYGDCTTAVVDIPSGGNAQENLIFDHCTIISKNADEQAIQVNGTGNTGAIISCFLASDAAATILDAGGLSVSDDTKLVVIGNGEPSAMPANKTLYDLLGAYTADGGADDEDTIMAHLDLILADTAAQDTSAELVALVDPNYISYDSPRVVKMTTSAMTEANGYGAADDPVIFTVTGDILCKACCHITTQITSTSNDTLELGVTGNTAILLVQDIADGTAFDAGDDWSLITAADNPGAQMADEWTLIGGGADIVLTIDDHDLTAGVATFYLFWIPLSADAAVTAATPS